MMSFFENCHHIEINIFYFRFMVSFSKSDTIYKILNFIIRMVILLYILGTLYKKPIVLPFYSYFITTQNLNIPF